ncbi:hypothetical protein [Methanofollis aquaemaris]|uniref:hypothetical protein n=1 Tax=Methanofollis aquaemaris TaxID=126734 RepID=UPI00223FBD06|nr:hypothetical protein [Methanofollis aquaemaris]
MDKWEAFDRDYLDMHRIFLSVSSRLIAIGRGSGGSRKFLIKTGPMALEKILRTGNDEGLATFRSPSAEETPRTATLPPGSSPLSSGPNRQALPPLGEGMLNCSLAPGGGEVLGSPHPPGQEEKDRGVTMKAFSAL